MKFNTVAFLQSKLKKTGDEITILHNNLDTKIKLLENILPDHNTSLWYGGEIAEITYKDYKFVLAAFGDIRAVIYKPDGTLIEDIKDKNNAGEFGKAATAYFKNDEELIEALENQNVGNGKYAIEIHDQNWFECYMHTPDGEYVDLMWVHDSDAPYDAIEEILDAMDEIIQDQKAGKR